MRSKILLMATAMLLAVSALVAQTPLTPLFNLRGKTDQNGALYITNFAAAAPDTPLTNLGNLRGKTDSNGALYVTCTGCSGTSFPILATTATDNSSAAPQYSFETQTGTGMFYNFGSVAFAISGSRKLDLSANTLSLLSDTGALKLGSAEDTAISRVAAGEFGLTAVAFASLGTPANGTFAYCSDCTFANPCAGAGTGAFAKRLGGAWRCD